MKVSIIAGLVLSVVSFGSLAVTPPPPLDFTALKSFSADICSLENATGANNTNVGIMTNEDGVINLPNSAKYTIKANSSTVKLVVSANSVIGLSAPFVDSANQLNYSNNTNSSAVVNGVAYPWNNATNTITVPSTHTIELKVNPKLNADLVAIPKGNVEIHGKVSITCS